jgi:hypothetical protein
MIKLKLPKLSFPYGTVERALAIAYDVPEAVRPAGFRSMVTNLQKLGALGAQARVGRGVALVYTPLEMHRLLLTLEFCELGLAPSTAVSLVDSHWKTKLKAIVDAAETGLVRDEPTGKDVILYLGGVSLRTGSLRGEAVPGVPGIGCCSLDELPIALKQWMAMTLTAPPRALVVNLSGRLRAFHNALADAHMEDPRPERRASVGDKRPPQEARKTRPVKRVKRPHLSASRRA